MIVIEMPKHDIITDETSKAEPFNKMENRDL